MSVLERESDEDVLMYNAQGNPRIETTVNVDNGKHDSLRSTSFGGIGVTRTVDVDVSSAHESRHHDV
jgi:hypothetical protein